MRNIRRATALSRGCVVLAAGDFTNDPELKARYMGPQEAKVEGVNITATGDGQKLALALGARIVNGDLALGPEIRFIPPANAEHSAQATAVASARQSHGMVVDHMPSALLRPFVMSFLTTALAPSPAFSRQARYW